MKRIFFGDVQVGEVFFDPYSGGKFRKIPSSNVCYPVGLGKSIKTGEADIFDNEEVVMVE